MLEGHHTLSELRSLNEKETEKINKGKRDRERWGGSVGRWSGKDKSVGAAHCKLYSPPPPPDFLIETNLASEVSEDDWERGR